MKQNPGCRLPPRYNLSALLCALALSACSGSNRETAAGAGGMGGVGGAASGANGGKSTIGSLTLGGATHTDSGGATLGGDGSIALGGRPLGAGGTSAEPKGGASPSGGAGTGGTANSNGGASEVTAGGNASGGKSAGGASVVAAGGNASGGKSAGGTATGGQASGSSASGGVSLGGKPATVTAPSGATLVTLNPSVKYQTFEGWGTSMCWWANRIGAWSTDKVNQFVEQLVNPTTGLGYNIFRYNIGGGENPSHTHMTEFRDMPGFQPAAGTWTWDADARQTAVLKRIVATGQDVIVEAFSNSPPYWMTKSGCASGSTDGSNNLKDDAYDQFADYLTAVVKHYRDELGITFRTLEPMNEPNANWWTSNGSQEGCHFGASSQQQLIKAVGAQLVAKGLTGTHVSASDENSMDDGYSIISGYDATTLGYVEQLNVHSYAGTKRAELRTLATSKGKRLWQSESGPLSVTLADNTASAIFMAERIITDLRLLKPQAWIDWQTYDTSGNWTSFSMNASQQTATPVKRFYMHAAFSRFIRPGAVFVDIDNTSMVAALSRDGATLAVVVLNSNASTTKSYTFDLTKLSSVGASVAVYRTSATENLTQLSSITLQNWSFSASAAPNSVTTYVIPVAGKN